MKYKSDFSKFNFVMLFIPVLLVFIINLFTEDPIGMIIIPMIVLLAFLLTLFTVLYFTTYYKIQNNVLIISMFFYKTKIKISEIKIIKYSNSIIKTNLYKPGFHYKGIELKYHKFDDIFISPEKKEQFIAELLEHNSNIEIKK